VIQPEGHVRAQELDLRNVNDVADNDEFLASARQPEDRAAREMARADSSGDPREYLAVAIERACAAATCTIATATRLAEPSNLTIIPSRSFTSVIFG
jgi:hypothetical protein